MFGKKNVRQSNREGLSERFIDPCVQHSVELDMALIDVYDKQLAEIEWLLNVRPRAMMTTRSSGCDPYLDNQPECIILVRNALDRLGFNKSGSTIYLYHTVFNALNNMALKLQS